MEMNKKYYTPLIKNSYNDTPVFYTVLVEDKMYLSVSTTTNLDFIDENEEEIVIGWQPLKSITPSYIKDLVGDDIRGLLIYDTEQDEPIEQPFRKYEDKKIRYPDIIKNYDLKKETETLNYFIQNKFIKNELTDIEHLGIGEFVYNQFEKEYEYDINNFKYWFCDTHNIYGLCIEDEDARPHFKNTDIYIKAVFIGSDNTTLYYLTEENVVYSYKMGKYTVNNN